ncbi:hypothetical protein F5B18DRAFT_639260 [Nemania serpens]|nr:hypothetical protein F5B18DRAFT_639260 [Nemania serpens]
MALLRILNNSFNPRRLWAFPASQGRKPHDHDLAPRRSRRYPSKWSDTWLWEILAILLSGVSFVSSLIILKIYNNKPVPEFSYGITLNAIISVLTTLSKSSLLVVVSGAISQLKWRWFHNCQATEGRNLLDLQLFDDASRGPWGSIVLLATPRSWSLVSIGAVVSILALAFDPFTQQIITYPSRTIVSLDQPSNISRAELFIAGSPSVSVLNVSGLIRAALWDLQSDIGLPTFHCPTGNCVWDEFESLASCSSCQNQTEVTMKLLGCSTAWDSSTVQKGLDSTSGDGYQVEQACSLRFDRNFPWDVGDSADGPIDFSITGEVVKSHSRRYWYPSDLYYPSDVFGVSAPIQRLGIMYEVNDVQYSNSSLWKLDPLPLLRFCQIKFDRRGNSGLSKLSIQHAVTCQLIPCVGRYSFTVKNGVPSMKVLDTRYGSWYFNLTGYRVMNGQLVNESDGSSGREPDLSWSDEAGQTGRFLNLGNAQMANLSARRYQIGGSDLFPFLSLTGMFRGKVELQDQFAEDNRNEVTNKTGISFKQEFITNQRQPLSFGDPRSLDLQQISDQGGLTWAIPRIAARLSNFIREGRSIPVLGRSYTSVTIVEVRWSWLALPIVTLTLGSAFLFITMWLCPGSGQAFWKASTLPLIYHGVDPRDISNVNHSAAGQADKISGMEKLAGNFQARLRREPITGEMRLARVNNWHIALREGLHC